LLDDFIEIVGSFAFEYLYVLLLVLEEIGVFACFENRLEFLLVWGQRLLIVA
jgi:hypothetical protein